MSSIFTKNDVLSAAMSLFVKLIILQISIYTSTSEWTYENQSNWPGYCKGHYQSPIKLPSKNLLRVRFDRFKFDLSCYDKNRVTVKNTGHTVEIRFADTDIHPTISGGGLEGEYVLEAFHFHWPSEHAINGRKFPLEGHFVFYAKTRCNIDNALKFKNGVAVLGVLYTLQDRSNPAFGFVSEVAKIDKKFNVVVSSRFTLALTDLIPTNSKFYRYEGSLTTPGCNEVVVWTVFMKPLRLSKKQMKDLTKIWDLRHKLLRSNNRKLQKLHGRQVSVGM